MNSTSHKAAHALRKRGLVNRQGFPILGGLARNARQLPQSVGCLHKWKHDPDCDCRCFRYCEEQPVCVEICAKCGVSRGNF